MTRLLSSRAGYGLLLVALVGGAFLATEWVTGRNSSEAGFLPAVRKQTGVSTEQELRSREPASSLLRLAYSDASGADGIRLEVGPDGNLFIVEEAPVGRVYFREFTPAGELVADFSTSDGPDFDSITDMAFDDERLWVADLLGSSVHQLDRTTRTWTTMKFPAEPYRIEVSRHWPRHLLVMRVGAPKLFEVTDARGKVEAAFGDLLADQENQALVLDGFIARCGESLLFSGKYLGLLASFTEGGEFNYAVESIEPPSTTAAVVSRGGKRWVRHGPILASRDISGDTQRFGVLASRPRRLEIRAFIDLYRTDNGQYYKSLLLPREDQWTGLAIGMDGLYAASTRRIVRWPHAVLSFANGESRLAMGQSIIAFVPRSPAERKSP